MEVHGAKVLGPPIRRRPSLSLSRSLKQDIGRCSRLPLKAFRITSKALKSPIFVLLDYEKRLLKPPLVRIGKLMSQVQKNTSTWKCILTKQWSDYSRWTFGCHFASLFKKEHEKSSVKNPPFPAKPQKVKKHEFLRLLYSQVSERSKAML